MNQEVGFAKEYEEIRWEDLIWKQSQRYFAILGSFIRPPHHCGSCAVSPAEVILARKSFSSKNSLGNFLSDQSYLFSDSQIKKTKNQKVNSYLTEEARPKTWLSTNCWLELTSSLTTAPSPRTVAHNSHPPKKTTQKRMCLSIQIILNLFSPQSCLLLGRVHRPRESKAGQPGQEQISKHHRLRPHKVTLQLCHSNTISN